jgi:hypothetical protein
LLASTITTEFPGIYARFCATVIVNELPSDGVGDGVIEVVVLVLYLSPAIPVGPVGPV